MSNGQLSFLPEREPGDAPAGWQLHPSTLTAHYFPLRQNQSLCKRETRHGPRVQQTPGTFPCTLCARRLPRVT